MYKNLYINDIDMTNVSSRYGYKISYRRVDGGAGGVMLDGSETYDTIALKCDITCPLFPLAEANLQLILTILYSAETVSVTYFDAMSGTYKTGTFRAQEVGAKHLFQNCYGDEVWLADSLVLRES